MYAVLDVETTGLNPGWKHRIAEIAIVLVDQDGRTEQEWHSLVNPERDLGPQHIHGIRAADVRHAPTFLQLAPQIAKLLVGRVLVAHNLSFDAMFLCSEFDRIGVTVPIRRNLGLCTMSLAADYLPTSGRSLYDCCLAAGIELDGWHSALADARAAAGLLKMYLSAANDPPPWIALLLSAPQQPWPILPSSQVAPVTRSEKPPVFDQHFLSRLVDRLPRVARPAQADTYLAILDHVVADRHISDSEADELVGLATDLGLDRATITELHHAYLTDLARTALADSLVTDDERRDLQAVAALLGLGPDAAETALTTAAYTDAGHRDSQRFRLRPGDTVILTGQMREPREVWENRGRAAGLNMDGNSVTKKTTLLVAADRDSLSGKARKAREYGIPIVSEQSFGRLLAELRERNTHRGGRG